MAINDIIQMYASPHSSTTEDGRMLALSLAEIQSELMRLREQLGKNTPIPAAVISKLDTSAFEAAIAKLTPLPPQNLDLNPVYRSYEQTATAIKELLGEVKTTNTRIGHIGGGGFAAPDPKHLIDIKRHISDADTRFDYDTRTDSLPVYVGHAEAGTLATSLWAIEKYTYDDDDRVTLIEVLYGAWASRASLPWEGYVPPAPTTFALLTEDGFNLLTEDGFTILLED